MESEETSAPIIKPSARAPVSWLRSVWSGLRTLLICYLGVMLVLLLLENKFVYPRVTAAEDWQAPPSPDIQDVTLRCADGVHVHGWWLPQPDAKSALLYLHGNGGNLSWRGKSIVKIRGLLDVSVLIVDYPGYGRSEGRPSETGCYRTADAGYAWLTKEQKVSPKNLLIYGKSLGGAVAVDLANRKEHRALILVRTFTSAPDVGSSSFPWLPVRWIMRNRFASVDKIRNIRRPVFFAHSIEDEVVPYALGQRLFEAANEPKEFLTLPRSGHNESLPDEMFTAIDAFVTKHAPME